MKRARLLLSAMLAAGILILISHLETQAATVRLSDYWFAKGAGDLWNYTYTQPILPNPNFTVAITPVTSGTYAGKWRMGDYLEPDGSTLWRISSFDQDYFIIYYDNQHGDYIPPGTIPIVQELDKMVPNPFSSCCPWYFKKQTNFTVTAGTFNDILLMISLDKNFGPTVTNDQFGLDRTLVPYAVTHVTWYARRAGELQDTNYDALTGNKGAEYKLVSTNATPSRGIPLTLLLTD